MPKANILEALAGYGDIERFPRIAGAWTSVRRMPRETIREVIVLDKHEKYLFVTSAREGFNDDLAIAIFDLLRHNRKQALGAAPLALVEGLRDPRGLFDTLAVMSSDAHRKYVLSPEIQGITYVVFPMYRCELSGDEDADILRQMIGRIIRILEWNRRPSPVTWMKFVNTQIGIRSTNKQLGLTNADELYDQLSSMKKTGSFADVMNYRKEHMHVEFAKGKYHISFVGGAARSVGERDAIALSRAFLEVGAQEAQLR